MSTPEPTRRPTLKPTANPTCDEPLIVVCVGNSITAGSQSECEDPCDERFGDESGRGGGYSYPANLAILLARDPSMAISSFTTASITDAEREALYANSYVLFRDGDDIDTSEPNDDIHVSVFSADPSKAIVYNLGHSGRTLTDLQQYSSYWKFDFLTNSGDNAQLVRVDDETYESIQPWDAAVVMLGTNDAKDDADVEESEFNDDMTDLLAGMLDTAKSIEQSTIFLGTVPPRETDEVEDGWDDFDYDLLRFTIPNWIRTYAATYSLPVIEFHDVIASGFEDGDYNTENAFLSDGLHPNNDGYLAMAVEAAGDLATYFETNPPLC